MEIQPQLNVTDSVCQIVDRLASAYHAGRTLVLLTDYDGTLVPFVDRPQDAHLNSNVRHILERLAAQPRVRIGIVSGRAIDSLKKIVGIEGLFFGGTGGLELELDCNTLPPPGAADARELVSTVCSVLRSGLAEQSDVWIEEKLLGITLNYRNNMPERVGQLRALVAQALRPFETRLRSFDCARGIEITPDVGLTKGTAVRSIVDYLGRDSAIVFYAGNDANDADALETVVELGGIGLGIGGVAPSVAQYRLPDPPALAALLAALLQQLPEGASEGRSPLT